MCLTYPPCARAVDRVSTVPLRCIRTVVSKPKHGEKGNKLVAGNAKHGKKDMKPPRMTVDEKRLVREMAFDKGMTPGAIADTVGRHRSNIIRLLAMKKIVMMGRPVALTPVQEDRLEDIVKDMVLKADAEYEVTLPMVHRRSRLKCSERTLARSLRKRGYYFFRLYEKMILTPEDIKTRWVWSTESAKKSRKWWLAKVQIHLDNHRFRRASTAKGRKIMAKRGVRSVYRKKGTKTDALKPCFVKPSRSLRTNTGTKCVLKMGGVGGGKVLVWETIDDTWAGAKAAEMYTDVVLPALQKRYPNNSTFTILEDNDPTGNLSKKLKAA